MSTEILMVHQGKERTGMNAKGLSPGYVTPTFPPLRGFVAQKEQEV